MKKVSILFFLLVTSALMAEELKGTDALLNLEDAYTQIADNLVASVVTISAFAKASNTTAGDLVSEVKGPAWQAGKDEVDRLPGYRKMRSGSGMIMSADGYIATCRHIVINADSGEVADYIDAEIVDKGHPRARVVGIEPTLNLAVLKLELYEPLTPVKIGESSKIRIGQLVVALGDPFGPDKTFSVGNISATPNRDCYQEQLNVTQIQASVRIPEESYGGPLVNIRGEVIAMNMPRAIADDLVPLSPRPGDSTYAIPVSLIVTLYEALKEKESKQSPFLGVAVVELSGELRKGIKKPPLTGVYIDNVFDLSPAFDAGIRIGDIILSMDGKRIFSVKGFQKWLYTLGIGKRFKIELSRDGMLFNKEVTIVKRPKEANPSANN